MYQASASSTMYVGMFSLCRKIFCWDIVRSRPQAWNVRRDYRNATSIAGTT